MVFELERQIMITENYQTLTPAYGKDYKSKAEVEKDFRDGKDFVLNSPMGTTYCSISDFAPKVTVNLRFAKLAKIHVVKV